MSKCQSQCQVSRKAKLGTETPARKAGAAAHFGVAQRACVPLKESELLELEKDGLAWLAEVEELIATLRPINEYDTPYRDHLVTLWRNSDRNYRRHAGTASSPSGRSCPAWKRSAGEGHTCWRFPRTATSSREGKAHEERTHEHTMRPNLCVPPAGALYCSVLGRIDL